ncbi:MAG: DUF1847 domain-containing protein [Acidobacteria bacterium]|jgi:uncharacterized metal-binding protein/predicted Fe-Mo cluster-binding NifX family protein|nr:DUF1847 domain-containing protein [Acidobacteriota bacterium]
MMIVAVPLLEGRVAPRCTRAGQLLLATVSRGRVSSRQIVETQIGDLMTLLDLLRRHGAGALVCGGITADDRTVITAEGIDIVDNVACSAAEVIAAIDTGTLRRGLGFDLRARGRAGRLEAIRTALERYVDGNAQAPFDCLACADRTCLQGLGCPTAPRGEPRPVPAETRHLLDAAGDIALEPDRQLCRITELVYLCLEMEYARVGLAYCVDLFEPAQILAGVLRRFVEVVPVCCKIDNHEHVVAPGSKRDESEPSQWACNPLLQARVLNEAGTQLNVLVGLCIGADAVFTQASRAPVTALFVKDRSLANNPIGAVYSEYYLHESVALPRSSGASGRDGRSRPSGKPSSRTREAP